MKERTRDELGRCSLIAVAIAGMGITIAGMIVAILNFVALSSYFIVNVIK